MKQRGMLARGVVLVAVWMACSASVPAFAASDGCQSLAASPAQTDPAASDEVRVYIDPDTGELVSEPPPGQVPDAPAAPIEEPEYRTEVRPDGTVVLDLSDRPAEELRAEVVDGKTVICHGSERPRGTSD